MKLEKVKGPSNHHLYKRMGADGQVTFWVRYFTAQKGRLERSLKTGQLGEARLHRDEAIAKFLGRDPKYKDKQILVCDKFEQFLELKKIKAKATYDSMSNQWTNHLKEYFGNMYLDQVNESEWLKYVAFKRLTHPDRKFFNDRKYLSMFLNWLHRNGFIKLLPKLPNVDPEIKKGKVFSEDEISRLLSHSNEDLRLQVILGYTMGMRIGEIMSLDWSQIDFAHRIIHLPAEKTKIRKSRTFGISEAALNGLNERKGASLSQFVFPSPQDLNKSLGRQGNKSSWVSAKKKAGVLGRFHDLRHSFLTKAFKKSVNPALICHYAGLSLEEAERTYLHFTVEDTRVVSTLVAA